MAASLSGVFNVQELTDLGDLLVGGRLYTYVPATTTLKIAYTDAAGLVPHTYTADGLGGQYIALDARGELPAGLFLLAGGYDLALKTSAGATIWTRRAEGMLADLATAQGPGAIGFDAGENYPDGSLGAAVLDSMRVFAGYPALRAFAGRARSARVLAPAGVFYLDPSDTTTPDNGGTILVGAGNRRWKRDFVKLDVRWFGAVEGGDLAPSLNLAVAALKLLGGGDVEIPPSELEWSLSATVNVESDDIRIVGAGHGGQHDTGSGNVAATQIKWTGAANGDMFRFAPASGAVRRIQGNALKDVYLLANGAARGCAWLSVCNGAVDIAGSEFNIALLDVNVVSGPLEARDSQHNEFSVYGRQLIAFGVTLRCDGDATANTSFNVFNIVAAQYNASPAVLLRSCDNNTFVSVHLVRASGGVAQSGIHLGASSSTVACGNNLFLDVSPGTSGVFAEGSSPGMNPSVLNRILYYDTGNGPPRPVIGTGASLFWESNTAAPGKRRQGSIAMPDGRHFWEESDGRIVVYGLTQTLAAGASVTILSPYTFGVGPDYINVSVNSASASTTCKAAWNGTGVVVTNTGAASADFWYRFEGY